MNKNYFQLLNTRYSQQFLQRNAVTVSKFQNFKVMFLLHVSMRQNLGTTQEQIIFCRISAYPFCLAIVCVHPVCICNAVASKIAEKTAKCSGAWPSFLRGGGWGSKSPKAVWSAISSAVWLLYKLKQ